MSGYVLRMSWLSWRLCLVMLMMLGSANTCFIRNCPRGGKRGIDSTDTSKQCMACGPRGEGQCVGPSICCGQDFGCLIGTQETEVCQKENENTTPCVVRGRQCGVNDIGNCVADGICCEEEACSFNSLCRNTDEDTGSTRQELLTLIRRLLVNRQFD